MSNNIFPGVAKRHSRFYCLSGKIGVCCYSTEVERNAKYHVNITFYRYWLSGNYEQRLGRFSFKIGACCYTPLKTAQ